MENDRRVQSHGDLFGQPQSGGELVQKKKILSVMLEAVNDPKVIEELITTAWDLLRSKPPEQGDSNDMVEPQIKKKQQRQPSFKVTMRGKEYSSAKALYDAFNFDMGYSTFLKRVRAGENPEKLLMVVNHSGESFDGPMSSDTVIRRNVGE